MLEGVVIRNKGVKTGDQPGFSHLLFGDVDCYQSALTANVIKGVVCL